MTNFATMRFGDRIFDREDNGSAFERFVDEFLRLQAPDKAVIRGLAKGRDGAIDLFDTGQKLTQIVECKYIGSGTDGTASKRWGEVESHLKENLPKAAVGNGAEKYRPWLKSQSNLQTYRFVTSAISADVDERNRLRQRICEFFAKMSQEDDELSHLRNLTVDLRYWDDLVGHCSTFAPLFYRWFGGFPQGYGEILVSFGTSETGFKRFLESRNLPYFSRDTYEAQVDKKGASHFETALEHLTKGNEGRALVISGPGGIGKTRMSIEICERARDQGWWPVRLERKAPVANLDELCAGHADTANLLLFIDYAEAFEELDQLPEAISRLARDGRHRISILASTRSSSIQRVADQLTAIETSELALRNDAEGDGYNAWVVRQILDHFGVPDAETVARSCSSLPVMAAFAAFLYVRDRAKFDEQFGNLVAVKDFADWATTRLKYVEDRFPGQPVQRVLAELAVRLPMPMTEAEAFRAASDINRDLFGVLKADHWIEPDGDVFSAAHDVLADAMLARHLAGMPGSEQDRLQDLLGLALTEDRLDRCLAAVDRLGQHSVLARLSGRRAVEALTRRDRLKALAQLPALAQSRLVTPADIIDLLAASEDMRLRLSEAPDSHLALARTAEWAATKGRGKIDRASAETALAGPLRAAVDSPHPSNIMLRCAYAFDPARYRADVFSRLTREPVDIDSHYLIVSLLRGGNSPSEVLPHLEVWLAQHDHAFKASFVYQSWLDADGNLDVVRTHVLAWFKEHETKLEAQFVYKSWLDAEGDLDAVRNHVHGWLKEHATKLDAEYVYGSWLDANGDLAAVRDHFHGWLKEHSTKLEAGFVYQSWLDAKGDLETVRDHIHGWLKEHATKPAARFVYRSWLYANGDLAAMRDHIHGWLEEHATKLEAEFVYKSWLDANGDLEAVRDHVHCWLDEHATKLEARFVYQSWLDAKGDLEPLRDHVDGWLKEHATKLEAEFVYKSWLDANVDLEAVRELIHGWLKNHATKPEAQFVYKAWLDADQPFENIRSHCEAWLKEHWRLESAAFVTKALSSRSDLSPDSIACIVAWAGEHARHEDAIFRLSRVSRWFATRPSNSGFTKLVARATNVVFENLLTKATLSGHERDACSILFSNLAKNSYPRDGNWPVIVGTYCACLKHSGVCRHLTGMPRTTWSVLLNAALELKLLDPSKDGAAISHAVDLIHQAMSKQELNELVASGYFGAWRPDYLDASLPETP